MAGIVEQLTDHAAATQRGYGYFVGDVMGGTWTALGVLRCVNLTSDGLPDWNAETQSVGSAVPCGMKVVGWYAVGIDSEEMQSLVKQHAAALCKIIDAEALPGAIFAAALSGGSVTVLRSAVLSAAGAAFEATDAPASCDELLVAMHGTHVLLRARPLVHLHVHHADGADWSAAQHAACAAAAKEMRDERACFVFPQARHVGVVSLEQRASRAAPLATGACDALLGSVDAEGDDEGEGEEDEEEEAARGGKKSGGKKGGGKKGGGKKGGKKPTRSAGSGGKPSGVVDDISASLAVDAAPHAGGSFTVQVLWPQCAAASAERHTAPVLTICPMDTPTTVLDVAIQLDAIAYARHSTSLASALGQLQAALVSQLEQLCTAWQAAAHSPGAAASLTARAYLFRPDRRALIHTMP